MPNKTFLIKALYAIDPANSFFALEQDKQNLDVLK